MNDIKFREVEFAAACAIGFANEMGTVFNNDIMANFRTRIYKELHSNIEENCGFDQIGQRILILSGMLQQTDVSC
jgi:hypothetical protein